MQVFITEKLKKNYETIRKTARKRHQKKNQA